MNTTAVDRRISDEALTSSSCIASGMRFFIVVMIAVAAAVLYGVVHDQVTVRISLEYFTIGHPPVFETTSPTVLALGWGVLATWWVGLPLGFLLASASTTGRREPLELKALMPLMACLLLGMAACAAIFGVTGYLLALRGVVDLPDTLAPRVPPDRHARFVAAWWAHGASYSAGILGGLSLVALAWRKRTCLPQLLIVDRPSDRLRTRR